MKINRIKNINPNEFKNNKEVNNKNVNLSYSEHFENSPSEPLYWQNLTFRGNVKSYPYKNFDDFFGLTKGIAEKCIKECNISEDDFNKLTEISEKGKITKHTILRIFEDGIKWYDEESKNSLSEVLSLIYGIYENNDEDEIEFLNNICNENVIKKLDVKTLKSALIESNPIKREFLNFFINNSEKDEGIFYDFEKFNSFSEYADENNIKSVEKFILDTVKNKGYHIVGAAGMMQYYKNPVTNLFDFDLVNAENELKEKYDRPDKFYDSSLTSSILPCFVSGETGKTDKAMIDFAERIFFIPRYGKSNPKLKDKIANKINARKFIRTGGSLNYSYVENVLPQILDAAKDKNGALNKTNIKYLLKIIETEKYGPLLRSENFRAFNLLKDENGIIDRQKFSIVYDVIKENKYASNADGYIEAMNKFGVDFAEITYEKLKDILGDKALSSMAVYMNNCLDEDGFEVKENVDFLENSGGVLKGCELTDNFFKLPKTSEMTDILIKIGKNYSEISCYDIDELLNISQKYGDENGKLDPFVKDELLKYIENKSPLDIFAEIFEACIEDKNDIKNNFNHTLLTQISAIYSAGNNLKYDFPPEKLKKIIQNREINFSGFSFKQRMQFLNALSSIVKNDAYKNNSDFKFVNSLISEIEESLSQENIFSPVQKEEIDNFKISVFGNKKINGEDYTSFEKTLVDSIPLLKEMKDGLKLSYSRKDFMEDLNSCCDTDLKKEILSKKTGIDLLKEGGKIKGYNGLIILDELDRNNEFENSIYELCYKFLYQNSINTGNSELDKELNTIIKMAPEFINTIGKPQHETHDYSLDIHQLLVLANSIKNPDYKKLNGEDKKMLKAACIFHDIAKKEDIVDRGHQDLSAFYAKSISNKIFKNNELKDRFFELVKNHHWLEEYTNYSGSKDEIAKKTAFKFRRPNDFEIAKIMAKSDLMAVSDEFYENHKTALDEHKIKPVEDKLNEFYSAGNALFTDYPFNEKKLEAHKEALGNREYKVINFHNIKNDEDLFEYGFERDKTKNDVQFLVHMVDEHSIKENLASLKFLSSSSNEGVLSESLITPYKKRTYRNRKYGVLLSQINSNLINMAKKNQGSGIEKGADDAISLIFNNPSCNRTNFKNALLKNLKINEKTVSNRDYAEFFRLYLANMVSLSQINNNDIYLLGSNKIKGSSLKEAINKCQTEELFVKDNSIHNEIVGYAPKIRGVIAKEQNLKDVPVELLNFAYENNLPVILI